MFLSRRSILALSVLATTAAHIAFLLLAEQIPMIRANAALDVLAERFNVQILDELPAQEEPAPAEEAVTGLASRPGSIEDLLKAMPDMITPPGGEAPALADIPNLPDRAAAEPLPRQYDLAPEESLLKNLDEKVLAIDKEIARENIEVARRLVRPGPDRLLGESETPRLDIPAGDVMPPPVRFGGTAPVLMTGSAANAPGAQPGEERPPQEALALPKDPAEPKPPEAKIEEKIARAPVDKEAAVLRDKSPYAFMDDLVDIKLDAYVPPDEKEGYFRLRILPKKNAAANVLPKQVTFVVDASSSIQQRKLDVTAKGVDEAIQQLRAEDWFNVVVFRDTPTMFQGSQVHATPENKSAARQFLKKVQSRGETDVYKGILPVVQEEPPPGSPGVVLVVSDGRPTTGMRDARTIINGLTSDNNLRNSIYAFGGGNTVDRYLLDLLAYRNKGEASVVKNIDDIAKGLPQFFERLNDPLLVDLRADYGRVNENKVFPSVLPDFYRDQPVTIYGRFEPKKDKEFFMRLRGQAGEQKKDIVFIKNLQEAESGDRDIPRGWAFQKAYHLIGEISRQGETPELLRQLQELGQKYNIRTSYSE